MIKKAFFPFFILIFLFLSISSIFSIEKGFYSTVSFTINNLPDENVTYDTSQLRGDMTSDIVREKNILDFTIGENFYRLAGVNTDVFVPPFSEIGIGYYWYNNTDQIVNVEKIRIPINLNPQNVGDQSDFFRELNIFTGQTCAGDICRGGKFLEIDGLGLVSPDIGQQPRNGILIKSLEIVPTVEIYDWEIISFEENIYKIKLYIRNNTQQVLRNMSINVEGLPNFVLRLDSYEEVELVLYKDCELSSTSIDCGSILIVDNSMRTRCSSLGYNPVGFPDVRSISVFSKVNGQWIVGSYVQPRVESFCITRMPYMYQIENLIVYLEPDITQEEYWKNELNLDVLPIAKYSFDPLYRYISLLKPPLIDNLNIL